ncbi:MAG TPA: BTAD domain-containing putative transcriptional regulator, partial [Clostridia bacterium]|nr:BTAD domain-containing putative transcriptional regulator [Clostridia bacterium]
LLLNRDKTILMRDLFEVLWPGENSANPESALKTLISRLRSTLAGCTPLLAECIVTDRGGYRWNPALECEIDMYAFEDLCDEILETGKFASGLRDKMGSIMELYAGELLPGAETESWVAARSVTLHNLYLKTVQHYVELLKPLELYDEIAQMCRMALDVDAFDSALNLELMTALLKIGHNNEALAQYNHATELQLGQPSTKPSDGMLDFYKKLIGVDNDSKTSIEAIRDDLLAEVPGEDGAFVCDYAILRDIYRLNMRNLTRLGATMFIALLTISNMDETPVEPLMLDKLMRILLATLRETLRRGDTIARYSPTQYAVLLPAVSFETGRIPLERVKKSFYKKYSNPAFVLSYRLAPVADEE